MLNWFLSTSVLIAVILLLRHILRNKIDPRLTYALWLLVALRICVPVSFFSLPVSVATFTQESGLSQAAEEVREAVSPKSVLTTSLPADSDVTMEELEESWDQYSNFHIYEVRPYTEEELAEIREEKPNFYVDTDNVPIRMTAEKTVGSRPFWDWIYWAGVWVTFIALGWVNRDFHKRVKQYRRPYEGELPVPCPVPVYVMPSLPSPCLYQMFRTAIYLNDAAVESDRLDHILTHEIVHYRHKDQWWAAVRILCLCVQWFNPLVWLAAYLSRQDCELACDASVIRQLGEDQRLSYGKTLVDMIAAGRHPGAFLQPATTMTGGKKSITQRIQRIVKRPKMTAVTLVAVLLIAALTAACAFGGATQKKDSQALDGYFGTTYVKAGESVVDHVQPIAVSYSPSKVSIGEITITENYFGCFDEAEKYWGRRITNPVYKEVDFDPSAYGESDRFYPALDDFFGGYDSITVYDIENADKGTHLLILDGELWMAIGVGSPTCYILRLEEYTAPPESGNKEPIVAEPAFDSEAEATFYHSLSQLIQAKDSLTVSIFGSYLSTEPDLEKQFPTQWLSGLNAIWESRFGSYTWTLCEGDPTEDAIFSRLHPDRLTLSSDSLSISFGPGEYVSVTTGNETYWYQMAGCKFSFDAAAQWLVSCVEQADDLIWEAVELSWDFPFSSRDVISTALPIDLAFDFDHYDAYIYGGVGCHYHSDGSSYGSIYWNETGTLYWSPYFDQDVFFPETPLLTMTVYDKENQPLVTATFTFHLTEKTDNEQSYLATVTLHGGSGYTCVRNPDTGGFMIAEAESVFSTNTLTEEDLISLVYPMEVSMRDDNSFLFDNPEELSASQLYTLFLLLTDYEVLEQQYHPEEKLFYFTSDFITAQLQKHFKSFRFDITDHEKYDADADAIVTPTASGFGGDRNVKLKSANWVNSSTVTFTLWFYDNFELTGDPYQAKTYTIEFYNGGCYFLSAVKSTPTPAADLAQSVYEAIVGTDDSRDFFVEVADAKDTQPATRVHITPTNDWNVDYIGWILSCFHWEYAQPDGFDAPLALTLESADGTLLLRCWDGTDRVILSVNGELFFLTANDSSLMDDDDTLFPHIRVIADEALMERCREITIDGAVTDYKTVAETYARQYAANLSALPHWTPSAAEDVVYRSSSVSQAYFGEGTENFCGSFTLYFSPEMGNSVWQAGSGMTEVTEGEYAGWWEWSIGVAFARNEGGDWVCTGIYTGGERLTYPTPLDEATMEELVYYFDHTYGNAHDYLIPYYICLQPVSAVEELNRLLGEYDDPDALCAALGAFLRNYGDYEDIQLTYGVLSAGLNSKYRPCLNEGYTGIPE